MVAVHTWHAFIRNWGLIRCDTQQEWRQYGPHCHQTGGENWGWNGRKIWRCTVPPFILGVAITLNAQGTISLRTLPTCALHITRYGTALVVCGDSQKFTLNCCTAQCPVKRVPMYTDARACRHLNVTTAATEIQREKKDMSIVEKQPYSLHDRNTVHVSGKLWVHGKQANFGPVTSRQNTVSTTDSDCLEFPLP